MKRCPTCGYHLADNEIYCPNCDLFDLAGQRIPGHHDTYLQELYDFSRVSAEPEVPEVEEPAETTKNDEIKEADGAVAPGLAINEVKEMTVAEVLEQYAEQEAEVEAEEAEKAQGLVSDESAMPEEAEVEATAASDEKEAELAEEPAAETETANETPTTTELPLAQEDDSAETKAPTEVNQASLTEEEPPTDEVESAKTSTPSADAELEEPIKVPETAANEELADETSENSAIPLDQVNEDAEVPAPVPVQSANETVVSEHENEATIESPVPPASEKSDITAEVPAPEKPSDNTEVVAGSAENSNETAQATDKLLAPVTSASERTEPSQTEKPKKVRKGLYIGLAVVVLAGGGIGWAAHQHQAQQQQAATEAKALETFQSLLNSFYTADGVYLRENGPSLAELQQDFAKLTKTQQTAQQPVMDELEEKQAASQTVNKLFTEPVLVGSDVKDGLLASATAAIPEDFTGTDAFYKKANQALAAAREQLATVKSAQEKMKAVYTDKVVASATSEQLAAAETALKAVKNQALVKTENEHYAEALTAAKKAEAQAKAEAEKKAAEKAAEEAAAAKAAEEKAAAEKEAAAEATKDQSTSANASTNQPWMATNQAQVADTANAAWDWAPGVQAKVIQTCIDRGYIVAGGYTLEPVAIENGEGYYNLYGTSSASSLLKGTPDSQLPVYLVTINCKTGWFQGNASRNN